MVTIRGFIHKKRFQRHLRCKYRTLKCRWSSSESIYVEANDPHTERAANMKRHSFGCRGCEKDCHSRIFITAIYFRHNTNNSASVHGQGDIAVFSVHKGSLAVVAVGPLTQVSIIMGLADCLHAHPLTHNIHPGKRLVVCQLHKWLCTSHPHL